MWQSPPRCDVRTTERSDEPTGRTVQRVGWMFLEIALTAAGKIWSTLMVSVSSWLLPSYLSMILSHPLTVSFVPFKRNVWLVNPDFCSRSCDLMTKDDGSLAELLLLMRHEASQTCDACIILLWEFGERIDLDLRRQCCGKGCLRGGGGGGRGRASDASEVTCLLLWRIRTLTLNDRTQLFFFVYPLIKNRKSHWDGNLFAPTVWKKQNRKQQINTRTRRPRHKQNTYVHTKNAVNTCSFVTCSTCTIQSVPHTHAHIIIISLSYHYNLFSLPYLLGTILHIFQSCFRMYVSNNAVLF